MLTQFFTSALGPPNCDMVVYDKVTLLLCSFKHDDRHLKALRAQQMLLD